MKRKLLINPYEGIDWDKMTAYDANFHAHSTESDGRQSVAVLIDQCKEAIGEGVFTITDHDTYRINRGLYPKVTGTSDSNSEYYRADRPTGQFRNTFPFSIWEHDIYKSATGNGSPFNELVRTATAGEFTRDEDGVLPNGLLAIEGNEVTGNDPFHDIVSLMCDFDGFNGEYFTNGPDELSVINGIAQKGGLSHLVHPGKYWSVNETYSGDQRFSPLWYKKMIDSNSRCLGIEIHNLNDRYPNDYILWDRINNIGFTPSPVWAFSGTDSHWDYRTAQKVVVFMEKLSESELEYRLINGHFFCSTGERAARIQKIEVDESESTITVETDSPGAVRWISGGAVIAKGNVLDYSKTKGINGYVRATIGQGENRTHTNPFYFSKFVKSFN